MPMPMISLVAFQDRQNHFIFVHNPSKRGTYFRTDRSVALVSCELCGSVSGEPCKGKQGYSGSTHSVRRMASKKIKENADDIVGIPNEV